MGADTKHEDKQKDIVVYFFCSVCGSKLRGTTSSGFPETVSAYNISPCPNQCHDKRFF